MRKTRIFVDQSLQEARTLILADERIILVMTEHGDVHLDQQRQQKKIEHWPKSVTDRNSRIDGHQCLPDPMGRFFLSLRVKGHFY